MSDQTDARDELNSMLIRVLGADGVDDNCPECGEVLETGWRIGTDGGGEPDMAVGGVCPSCGFRAVHTTSGGGRSEVSWPVGAGEY